MPINITYIWETGNFWNNKQVEEKVCVKGARQKEKILDSFNKNEMLKYIVEGVRTLIHEAN